MLTKYSIRTLKRVEFLDITSRVDEAVRQSGVIEGIAIVFCPHTTAGITINENADPSVVLDMINKTSKLIEEGDNAYRHAEGNSDSHIKSSLFGASLTLIIDGGRPLLGTWQGVYFAEFDGPRERIFYVKVIEG
ncbi:MAG: secondary thiamine-phosphate synthase enzyme YjbQ [Deltaproteobacteria bacterium]|nr:secondary thiamine-phosphate synthase enzyme YjbQ [Deltaproteobacteria bacterium]